LSYVYGDDRILSKKKKEEEKEGTLKINPD
jgi:hypothetical protein